MSPAPIGIHRISETNAEILGQVAEDVFDDDIDPTRLSAYLRSSERLLVVAVADKRVIGQVAAYIHLHPDRAADLYIDNLGVTPAFQRRGIARRLVDEVFAWGKTLGCGQAWIVTETDNDAARALYEKHGATAEPIVMFSYAL